MDAKKIKSILLKSLEKKNHQPEEESLDKLVKKLETLDKEQNSKAALENLLTSDLGTRDLLKILTIDNSDIDNLIEQIIKELEG